MLTCMRAFVTGATGYIGTAVCAALRRSGWTVVGLARSDQPAQTLAARGDTALHGDLLDLAVLAEGVRHADAVIHTALSASDTAQVDRAAVQAMIGAIQPGRPFIFTSGC